MKPPIKQPVYLDRVKMTVYFSRAEYEAFRAHAARSHVPMTQIARAAVLDRLRIKAVSAKEQR